MLRSFMYCSDCTLSGDLVEEELDRLVAHARVKNERLHVTGALMLASGQFVQFLEGSSDAIHALVDSIRADPRHTNFRTLLDLETDSRRFAGWSLAYSGTATFVGRELRRLRPATGEPSRRQINRVIRLLGGIPMYGSPANDVGTSRRVSLSCGGTSADLR